MIEKININSRIVPIQALVNALQIYTNFTGQTKCLDIKSAFDPSMSAWEFQVSVFERKYFDILRPHPYNIFFLNQFFF